MSVAMCLGVSPPIPHRMASYTASNGMSEHDAWLNDDLFFSNKPEYGRVNNVRLVAVDVVTSTRDPDPLQDRSRNAA